MTNPIQKQVAETSPVIAAESPSAIVSDARAAEIRGALCAEHGAVWMHYYHRAIEAEVLRILQANIDSPPPLELTDKRVFWPDESSCHPDGTYDAILTKQGTVLLAVDAPDCRDCAFKGQAVDGLWCIDTPRCGSGERTDNRSVIWVKQ